MRLPFFEDNMDDAISIRLRPKEAVTKLLAMKPKTKEEWEAQREERQRLISEILRTTYGAR